MSLRRAFKQILESYEAAKVETFAGHSLATFIRDDLRAAVFAAAGNPEGRLVKGSPGMGNWADGPWVAMFDPRVTTSAQRGYYPVFLFREDLKGLYLSLNQAMTEAKALFRSKAKAGLRHQAEVFRAQLGKRDAKRFPLTSIDLAPRKSSNDTAYYEAGNVCAKYYSADSLPHDDELEEDIRAMLRLYGLLADKTQSEGPEIPIEGDEPTSLLFEDASKFKHHKRIERTPGNANKVKRVLGYTCQVCDTNFEQKYGEIGKRYIEAHHLTPLSSLEKKKVALDPAKDFAVLCANCHRMIHRSGCVDDVAKFKKEHYRD